MPIEHDRDRLALMVNLAVTVLLILGTTSRWLVLDSQYPPLPGLIVSLLGIANCAYIILGGSTLIAGRFLIGLLLLGISYGGFKSGGFRGPIVLFAPLVPIIAFLLFDRSVGVVTAGIMMLCLISILVLQLTGAIPDFPQRETTLLVGRFIAVSVSGLLATWALWTFAGTAFALSSRNEQLANIDYLTGIANRRAIESALEREISRARRTGHWLSIIIADVDHFKRYNDINGHQAGDNCLVRVAELMVACTRRPADLVGRFGGEEFVVILPETDSQGACKVAEDIRQTLLHAGIPYKPGEPKVLSITLGVASCPGARIESGDKLIKMADEALYQGKTDGRNRMVASIMEPAELGSDPPSA